MTEMAGFVEWEVGVWCKWVTTEIRLCSCMKHTSAFLISRGERMMGLGVRETRGWGDGLAGA